MWIANLGDRQEQLILKRARKEPLVRLDAKATALLQAVGATHVWLTLSHTESHAMAVAALVRNR